MDFNFSKYQGAGNDFVLIDDRSERFPIHQPLIEKICDRHFGVGADGLLLLQNDELTDFKMVYFNSDGREGTMCGNGGRCIVRFAKDLGIIDDKTTFAAIDGDHEARIEGEIVELKMGNVSEVDQFVAYTFLNTGSPHHVEFVQDVDEVDVVHRGAQIRYGSPYFDEGTNVNFVEVLPDFKLKIRTYERGVEDETLACGTGITAAAIAAFEKGLITKNEVIVLAKGGKLNVKFEKNASGGYENVWLTGPAEFVFKGNLSFSTK